MESIRSTAPPPSGSPKIFKIYSIIEKPGNEKHLWLDIGVGRLNRDDSITCKLDCLPINGVIQIRPHEGKRRIAGSQAPERTTGKEGGY